MLSEWQYLWNLSSTRMRMFSTLDVHLECKIPEICFIWSYYRYPVRIFLANISSDILSIPLRTTLDSLTRMCVPTFMDSDGANRNPITQRSTLPIIALVSSRKAPLQREFFPATDVPRSVDFLGEFSSSMRDWHYVVTIKQIRRERERMRWIWIVEFEMRENWWRALRSRSLASCETARLDCRSSLTSPAPPPHPEKQQEKNNATFQTYLRSPERILKTSSYCHVPYTHDILTERKRAIRRSSIETRSAAGGTRTHIAPPNSLRHA